MIARITITKKLYALFTRNCYKTQPFNIVRRIQSPNLFVKYLRCLTLKGNRGHPLLLTAFTIFRMGASKTAEMASSVTLADLLQNADQLFDESKYEETLHVLNNFEDQSTSDIKWRQARAMYKLSNVETKRKAELIRSGFALVEEALKLNDKDFAIHKWFAILVKFT